MGLIEMVQIVRRECICKMFDYFVASDLGLHFVVLSWLLVDSVCCLIWH